MAAASRRQQQHHHVSGSRLGGLRSSYWIHRVRRLVQRAADKQRSASRICRRESSVCDLAGCCCWSDWPLSSPLSVITSLVTADSNCKGALSHRAAPRVRNERTALKSRAARRGGSHKSPRQPITGDFYSLIVHTRFDGVIHQSMHVRYHG